jgi:orotate phosphoribosyltransferase
VSIFTYGFPEATKAFETAGIPYRSLTNYSSLIELAVEKGQITAETEQLLLQWREDPANWKGI